MSTDEEEFSTTWVGGHALIIEFGDCEIYGMCQCWLAGGPDIRNHFGMIRPDQSLDTFSPKWERHVMQDVRSVQGSRS